ncbi:MAG: hypothetical protein LBU10_00620, partial [Endomicrobium sp.]|nr:hypothetical protein [Endomicrobium sp.]
MKSQGLDEPIVKSEDKYGKGGATQAITKSEIKNDVNEKEKMVNKNRIKLLLILCLSLNISSYFLMAQDIVIRDTVVNHYVFGNGDAGDNGNGTFDTIVLASQNNSVTILGIAGVGIIAGAIDRPEITEDVRSNSLVIDISTSVTDLRCGTTADVCGGIGRNSGSNAIENILRINNGDIQRDAFGGISLLGEAKNNKVIISGGVLRGDIGGGATQDSNANENKVIISGGEILGNIYGGMSGDGGAVGNTVEISGGEFLGNIYGGISRDGGAVGNTVEISGGEFLDNIYGGRSRDGGAVGNTVEISGGEFFADVYGGKSRDGGAVGNTVEISGDPKFSTNTFIYGGFTSTASVADVFTNNTLNIKT